MHRDAEQLIENVSQLVSPPEVYYQLESLIHKPHTSLDDIANVIRTDLDLSARLLRIANSAFYGFPAKVESIPRALATVGTRQLRDLVLATTVVRLFSQIPFELINMNLFWRHSMHTGLLARNLASLAGEPNEERFYLVGLLHDIGHLVLYLKLPDQVQKILLQASEQKLPRYQVEIDNLGYEHGELGAALLTSWRLPAAVIEPVRYHHFPSSASNYPIEATLVSVANALVHETADEQTIAPGAQRMLMELGIEEEQCAQARASAEAQLGEVISMFT
ncbi:MAG: HDOD domain-containing protein [Gammaproteobacteria bacterium]|nr:HDOD domain-containing protein [Gammaproteobacteria bacterium]